MTDLLCKMEKASKKTDSSTAATVIRAKEESFLGGKDFFKPRLQDALPAVQSKKSEGRQNTASTGKSSYISLTSKSDKGGIYIDAIPDILLSELDKARDVSISVAKESNVDSIQWELAGPNGFRYLTTDDLGVKDPFYISKMPKSLFVDAGKYYLRCYAFKSEAGEKSLIAVDEMDFNIITDPLHIDDPVENDFGEFKVVKYHVIDNPDTWYQVEIEIRFQPKDFLSQWTIGFIQSARVVDSKGTAQWSDEEWTERATKSGWTIDRWLGEKTPWFKAKITPGSITEKDGEYTYKNFYKEGAGSFAEKGNDAYLIDRPGVEKKGKARTGVGKRIAQFESCVVCKNGPYKGQIMGCITWGYEATAFSKESPGKVALMPLGIRVNPSEQFFEASKKWNKNAKKRKKERVPNLKSGIE